MIGIGVIAFDRPHYLARTLAALAQQQGAGKVKYHLFLDGAVNPYSGRVAGEQKNIDRCLRTFERAGLPNKTVHVQGQNLGLGLHQYGATEWMIGRYERVLMVEDDVVLSPYWVRLAGVLFEQFANRDDIFGFSPGFKRLGRDVDALQVGNEHWWCEAFTARAWRAMRPYYLEYVNLIRGVDYIDRDHDAIKLLYAQHGWRHPATSQDAAKDLAIHRAGMRRVCCEVNRAVGIGRTGLHWSPQLFAARGYEEQTPYTFEGDATRTRFDEPID